MTHGGEGFVWTPSARRSVNVLVAMQAMHLCATQVVMLASDDLLVGLLRDRFRKSLADSRERKLAEAGDSADARAAAEQDFEGAVKTSANSRAAHIMSMIMVAVSLGDFVIGPLLGGIADAWGRKFLMLIAPAVQGLFRAAIAVRPSVPLFVAFQVAQGVTNIMYGRIVQLMIGDIVPRHTFEYQRVHGFSSKVNTVLGLIFTVAGGRVSLRTGFLSSALLNVMQLLAMLLLMSDTLQPADRIPFTFSRAHPFAFISFFRKTPTLRNIGIFTMLSEAPNFESYNGLFQIHKFGWGKRQRSILHVFRRSVHYFNFNYYEAMVRRLGLTGTLRWGLRATALETLIPGLLGPGNDTAVMCGIVGSSAAGHKWKAMEAFKARETMLAGAGQGELQAADASLRVPLRIVCIPLFNWIYAKGSERGFPGLAHVVRGGWQLFSSEVLVRVLFPKGVGDVIWS